MSAQWSARRQSSACSGDVIDRPHVHPALGQPAAGGLAERVRGVNESRRPRSSTWTVPRGVEHQVRRLDVAVDDPLGMCGGQPARCLDQVLDRLDRPQRSPLADDAVQVAALDVFHHQEMDAPILVGVQRGDDVVVLELAGGLDFPLEPRKAVRSRANEGGGSSRPPRVRAAGVEP